METHVHNHVNVENIFSLESLMSVWDVADFEGIQTIVCIRFTLFWL